MFPQLKQNNPEEFVLTEFGLCKSYNWPLIIFAVSLKETLLRSDMALEGTWLGQLPCCCPLEVSSPLVGVASSLKPMLSCSRGLFQTSSQARSDFFFFLVAAFKHLLYIIQPTKLLSSPVSSVQPSARAVLPHLCLYHRCPRSYLFSRATFFTVFIISNILPLGTWSGVSGLSGHLHIPQGSACCSTVE